MFISNFKKKKKKVLFMIFFILLFVKIGPVVLILQGLYNVQIFHVNWDYSEKI